MSKGTENLKPATAGKWWDKHLLGPVKNDASCSRVAWMLTWANRSPDSYWVPLKGQPAYDGFAAFHSNNGTLFAGDFELPGNGPVHQHT